MRKLIIGVLLVAFGLIFPVSPVTAQQKVVHFKKLQEFLPKITLSGFERKKPSGSTQTAMGMTTSEAKVRYVKTTPKKDGEKMEEDIVPEDVYGTDLEESIEVTISDMTGVPFAAMAFALQQGDYEQETEEGYEKSVIFKKKYKGKETASTGEYKSCSLEFPIANRFLVKLQATNTDQVQLLHKLVEGMDVEKLEKTAPK